MKKLVIVLLLIGFVVFMTWDSEEKEVQKENNVQQIEKNIQPYLSDWLFNAIEIWRTEMFSFFIEIEGEEKWLVK